jgi:tetrapyrrole methylase family protein/MazG family protein
VIKVSFRKYTPSITSAGITILGLGPGDPGLLTREAWELLNQIPEIYLRTRQHPTVAGFPKELKVHSFDHFYENGESFENVYQHIVDKVIELGQKPEGVVYGVPGHPFVAEATSLEIARQAGEKGVPLRIVEGLSFIDATFTALQVDPLPEIAVVDAFELAQAHYPSFPPSTPALIAQIHSPKIASEVKLTLMAIYPDEHPVKLVHGTGTSDCKVENLPLYQIDRSQDIGMLTALYVPSLGENTSFEAFQEIVSHLRAPEGCPWDREQTHQSLRPHLLEETYEVLSALDKEDTRALQEELGDLLLQIVLHAQIASEFGEFTMADVLRDIHIKLVHRHPHVFGNLQIPDKQGVLLNWERLKVSEREAEGRQEESLLAGITITLPALSQAQSYQKRVARVGFDWPNVKGVFDKINEEIDETKSAATPEERAAEIGDLFFALVNLARWFEIDAESALRQSNTRFYERFTYLERAAQKEGRELADFSLDEMEALWQAAKHGDV